MKIKRVSRVLMVTLLCTSGALFGQSALDQYVAQGLQTNLSVKQLDGDYQKAVWALKEAKNMYGPSMDVVATYTHNFRKPAEIPAASASSDAARGLLQLLENSNMGMVDGNNIYFPPPTQFQGGLQLTQPVYSAELAYNRQAKEASVKANKARLEDFKRELEADIRIAYFQYLQAFGILKASGQGVTLAHESLSAVEKLILNQKTTKDALYKAKATASEMDAMQRNAQNDLARAQYYFNFLINRPAETPIEVDAQYQWKHNAQYSAIQESDTIYTGYKLDYLGHTEDVAQAQIKVAGAASLPTLQLKVFGGIQGSQFDLENQRLPIASIQLSLKWNLFHTGVNKARYRQATIQMETVHTQYLMQQEQLALNERTAYNDMATQLQNQSSVRTGYTSAQVYYEVIHEKFKVGTANILELTDAEKQLIQSSIDMQSWYYELLQKATSYNEVAGKYIIIISE